MRRAWDLLQVIRHRLAWDDAGNPPTRPSMQVMYDVPLNSAGEPPAEIQAIAAADIVPASVELACGNCGAREAISDGDVVEKDGAVYQLRVTPLNLAPASLPSLRTYSIIILSSEDGIDWAHAVIYPGDWATEEADRRAIAAFEAVQTREGDDANWTWETMKPELEARGFILAKWHRGPNWDTVRVPL